MEFLTLWLREIVKPLAAKGFSDLVKLALSVGAVSGVSALLEWLSGPMTLSGWVVVVTLALVVWVSFAAGIAFQSRGPSVSMGELQVQDVLLRVPWAPIGHAVPCRVFFVRVTNGPVKARPIVSINQLEVRGGSLGHAYEGHWRDHPANHSEELLPWHSAQIGLLVAFEAGDTNKSPMLLIWPRDHTLIPIASGARPQSVKVELLATCEPAPADRRKNGRTYVIVDDPDSALGFKIAERNPSLLWRAWTTRK
jgi:hypothetical protein